MSYLLEASVLVATSYPILGILERAFTRRASPRRGESRFWLRVFQSAWVLSMTLPVLASFLPRAALPEVERPFISSQVSAVGLSSSVSFAPAARKAQPTHSAPPFQDSLAALFLVGLALSLTRYILRVRRLEREFELSYPIRSVGKVSILASARASVPYACWSRGRALVVVPEGLLASGADLKIAVAHELQHHRQGDALWARAFEAAASVFFFHPFARAWRSTISRLQELSCDEALIGRRKVSPQDYGRCLLRAAEFALGRPPAPACTTGMAGRARGHELKGRIEMLFNYSRKNPRMGKSESIMIAGFALVAIAVIAFATEGFARSRELSFEEVRALAAKASAASGLPIEVNDLVLARLNRYLASPENRQSIREGLARMPTLSPMIERKLEARGMPKELLVVPLAEARYRNDLVSPTMRAAGIWQFIPETARKYGLKVDRTLDERLDYDKATDAALDYLRDTYAIFGDWRLALKAYNEGEARVSKTILQLKTRDPWVLERAEPRESYVSKIMAMLILWKNPQLVD